MKRKPASDLRLDEEEARERRRSPRRGESLEGERPGPATLDRVLGNRTIARLLGARASEPAPVPVETPGTEQPAGRPLEAGVRARMERTLGADLRDVRIHTDERAAAEVRRHGAEAAAVGNHVAFEHGRYRPGTPLGDALLAHELAHTVQQKEGDGGGTSSAPARLLEADANRSALAAVGALWGSAAHATARAGARVGPRLRSGTQMQFFLCEGKPSYETPSYLGPESRQALEDIRRIVESGNALQAVIVAGTVLTTVTSSPEETLASGSYDVTPQAQALRAVPVIVRARVIEVVTLLLVQHENDMNPQERQFWHNVLRQFNAL